jgi:hypothetical protein
MSQENRETTRYCVTLHGLPVSIVLEWPFKPSTAGADFHVLHGDMRLEDGRGLHALVAVQMTQTVREVLPSLEPAVTESPVVNTLRKAVDTKELEFVKSPKRLPVAISSRAWDFKRNQWAFAEASDDAIREFLKQCVYWKTIGRGENAGKAWLADPVELEYVNAPAGKVLEIAREMPELRMDGEWAYATEKLTALSEAIREATRHAAAELEQKHAFERG